MELVQKRKPTLGVHRGEEDPGGTGGKVVFMFLPLCAFGRLRVNPPGSWCRGGKARYEVIKVFLKSKTENTAFPALEGQASGSFSSSGLSWALSLLQSLRISRTVRRSLPQKELVCLAWGSNCRTRVDCLQFRAPPGQGQE